MATTTYGNYTPNRKETSRGGKYTRRLPGGGTGVQQRIDTYKHPQGRKGK